MLLKGNASSDLSISLEQQSPQSASRLECRPGGTVFRQAREVVARWETIRYLVASNLRAGHRDKVLGHLWSLLDPLLFVGVYFVVFGLLFGQADRGGATFVVYLSLGVLAFRFFEGTVVQCTLCIKARRGLIQEISFPKAVLPISVTLSRLYDLLWALLVLLPIMLVVGIPITMHILWMIPLVFLYLLFTSGLAFLAAYIGAFFADTMNVVTVLMRLLMYTSPTFYYAKDLIPERYLSLYMANPIACFFETFRDALLYGRTPEAGLVLYAAAVSVVVFVVGFAVFVSGEGRFAKYI